MTLFDTGVRPAIDKWLADEAAKLRDYGDYWSASSAGYCMRKVIFERLKVPPVAEDARKQRVFSSGHIFHEWIQNITKESGLSIAQELELQDEELMIRGHIDDLVLVDCPTCGGTGLVGTSPPPLKTGRACFDCHVGQNLILYDYKTAHSKWFEYVKDRPMSHYNKMQLGTYMYMLRNGKLGEAGELKPGTSLKFPLDLTEARILKISKDDLRLHEQQLLWTPELEKEVKDYWTTINKYWEEKKIPPCTCAEHEVNKKTGIGFMANPKYNPYFYDGEPCSLKWYQEWKEQQSEKDS